MSSRSETAGNWRVWLFALLTLACVLAGGAYVAWAAARDGAGSAPSAAGEARLPSADALGSEADPAGRPAVVFRHVGSDAFGRVAVGGGGDGGKRSLTPLSCERSHFTGEVGLCLKGRQGITQTKYEALIVDERFGERHRISLPGLLSRARVSPDGRYGATTSFVTGHSYSEDGMSTHTALIDMARGRVLADLEDFEVELGGKVVRAADRNFWGVTFSATNSDRFYATMLTGDRTWLIEGSVRDRRARAIHAGVECPSLSPDETRIAFKKRVHESEAEWRFHVLDLETMEETPLSETKPIDDQAEWLDDDTVIYGGIDMNVWSVRADGSGRPEMLFDHALSPAVLRPAAPAQVPQNVR